MTQHQLSAGSDDCQADVLPGLNFCVFDGGTLCYRHRFLLRKLLVNKVWSQVACRFEAWKTFCSRSRVLLDELLEVNQRQRRCCAFSRWKRMFYSQQLGEEAEATVIVRRSHQAAKKLARVVAKFDKLVMLSVWVEWRTWHRKQRCVHFQRGAMFQKRRRFRQWLEFAKQLKAHHGHRVQQVREILSEVVNFSVVEAEFTRAATSNDDPNHKEIRTDEALRRYFGVVHRFLQRQEFARAWSRWHKVCIQSWHCTTSPTPSDSTDKKRLQNRSTRLRRPQRIARSSPLTESKARKVPRPAWR